MTRAICVPLAAVALLATAGARRSERLGAFASIAALASGAPWTPRRGEPPSPRTMELPLQQTVVRF